jgi:aspartate racemase
MAHHIGIVACSAEGAALCYRTICLEAFNVMGEHAHPEITMNSIPMSEHMPHFRKNDWQAVAAIVLRSAKKVADAGAAFAICPDNTCHIAFEHFAKKSPIPWIHIAEIVADQSHILGYSKLGILGTRLLMESSVYPKAMRKHGIACEIPVSDDRCKIDAIIFQELVNGILSENARQYFRQVIQRLQERGCDAVVLGCTEIPLLIRPEDVPIPVLDSTRLLARAALAASLKLNEAEAMK